MIMIMNQSLWIYQVQSRIRSFSTQTGTAITTREVAAAWTYSMGILHVRCCIRIGTVAIHRFSSLLVSWSWGTTDNGTRTSPWCWCSS